MLPLSKWRNQSTDLSKQQPSKVTEEQARSISMPLRVAIMTVHYFGDEYARTVSNCTLEGIPLQCSYFQPNDKPDFGEQDAEVIAADAVWWHAPNTCLQAVSLFINCMLSAIATLSTTTDWFVLDLCFSKRNL